jgi:2EXR family
MNMVSIRAAPPTVNSFQKLPAELRIAIWTLLIQPRVVPITESNGQVYSTCPVPAILHICHESRQIGLKVYETSIGLVYANLTDCFGREYKEPLIYFNPKLDILYACRSFKFIWHLYPTLCQYKSAAFAIERHTFYDYFRATARTHRLRHDIGAISLGFFLGLQNIFLVFEEPGPVRKGDIELVDVLDDELTKLQDAQISDFMAILCRGKYSPKVSHKLMISGSGTPK